MLYKKVTGFMEHLKSCILERSFLTMSSFFLEIERQKKDKMKFRVCVKRWGVGENGVLAIDHYILLIK